MEAKLKEEGNIDIKPNKTSQKEAREYLQEPVTPARQSAASAVRCGEGGWRLATCRCRRQVYRGFPYPCTFTTRGLSRPPSGTA